MVTEGTPTVEGGEEFPQDAQSRRRVALVVGTIALLLLVLWQLFLRGGSDDPSGTAVIVPPSAQQDDSSGKNEGLKKTSSEVETFEVFAPKDPFEPLIEPPAPAAPATAEVAQVPAPTPDVSGSGSFGETTTIQGSGSTSSNEDTVGNHRVKVIDVFRDNGEQRAQIEVDGTVYTVDEGEVFAQNFQLVSASGQCATMLFGDDEFTLCEGEEILK